MIDVLDEINMVASGEDLLNRGSKSGGQIANLGYWGLKRSFVGGFQKYIEKLDR